MPNVQITLRVDSVLRDRIEELRVFLSTEAFRGLTFDDAVRHCLMVGLSSTEELAESARGVPHPPERPLFRGHEAQGINLGKLHSAVYHLWKSLPSKIGGVYSYAVIAHVLSIPRRDMDTFMRKLSMGECLDLAEIVLDAEAWAANHTLGVHGIPSDQSYGNPVTVLSESATEGAKKWAEIIRVHIRENETRCGELYEALHRADHGEA